VRIGELRKAKPRVNFFMKHTLPFLVALLAQLPAFSAELGEYRQHTEMPPVPQSAADYESMWDPFVLRLAGTGAPLEVKPEAESESRLFARFDALPWNGRQIARDGSGNWFVLAEQDRRAIFLASGPGVKDNAYRPRGGDLPAFELVGGGAKAVFKMEGEVSRASMVIAGDGSLHVVFHRPDGLWHLKAKLGAEASASVRDKAAWTAPVRVVEGSCRAGDLMRDAGGQVVLSYAQDDTVFFRAIGGAESVAVGGRAAGMAALRQFAATEEKIADDAAAPGLGKLERSGGKIPLSECESQDAVMDLAPDGSVWLAFRRDFQIWVTQRAPDGQWQKPELAVREYAFHPSIIIANGRPLIACHHDGLRRMPGDIGDKINLRAGGGSTIGYATLDDSVWRNGVIAEPEEITVYRRGMWANRGTGRLLPQIEQLGWPVLFRDPHGVVWALWQNTSRRWAQSARWLGEGFGEVQECRGPFNAPRLPVNAEKHAPSGASDAGVLFHAAAAGGNDRVLFDRLRIPALSTTDNREVLFLDALEVAATSGVDHKLNPMSKPTSVPALSPGDGSRIALGLSVQKRGDLYVMRYRSSFESGEGGEAWAVSKDGLHFEKVDKLPADLPEAVAGPTRPLEFWRGSAETRAPTHYLNPDKANPAKKFVRMGFSIEARGSYWLEYSPDAKQWTKDIPLTATEAMRERAQPNFFEPHDPERPMRIYSRVYTETGRSWGVIWSHDLRHWSGAEHLLDVDDPYGKASDMNLIGNTGKSYTMRGQIFLDAVAGKGEDEIYAASVNKAEGLYFAFYWPGTQGRPLTDIGIAVSRDGFNFTRVKNGERILPLGPPGAWDSGYIFQMNPMLEGENVRVFYRATAGRREGTDGFEHNLTEVGVATIRVNGFTCYTPREHGQPGSVTTIPIQSPAGAAKTLTVNLEGVTGQTAAFAVEVLDAITSQPIAGHASADCLFPTQDGIAVPVTWKDGATLPSGKAIRLRFHLRNPGVRLYSFGFK